MLIVAFKNDLDDLSVISDKVEEVVEQLEGYI